MKGLLIAAFCALAVFGPASSGLTAEGKKIRMSAPPVPQAVALLRAPESAANFIPWRSPEQLRAFVANNEVDAIIAPLPTAAVLSNRGIPCRVLAVYSAPLWIVSAQELADSPQTNPAATFASLREREILLPFGPGNMPELLLTAMASELGINLKMRHCGSALEAANLLRWGQAACAMLPEPAATLASAQESPAGRISKRLALKEVWLQVFPGQVSMPTAALVMVGPLAEDPAACALARDSFLEGIAWARANPEAALRLAEADYPELGKMLAALPTPGEEVFIDLGLLDEPEGAQAARFVLERLFAISPASVGGRLPDAELWSFLDALP